MVINHRYRFIYVHVPKSGGTSVSQALGGLPGNNPRWVAQDTRHEPLWTLLMKWTGRRNTLDRLLRRSPESYFVFGFVRNPWERIHSLYRYLCEQHPIPEIALVQSFTDFIHRAASGEQWVLELHSFRPQVDYFRRLPQGPLDADFIGHFETLETDFARVMGQLGIPAPPLPRANRSANTRLDYRAHYTDETAALIGDLFAEDSRSFGYRFDQRRPECVPSPSAPS